MGLLPTRLLLMRDASSLAMFSTTSFSRVPPGPMAPGSSPPWPGSSATMMRRLAPRPVCCGAGGVMDGVAGGRGGGTAAAAMALSFCAIKAASASSVRSVAVAVGGGGAVSEGVRAGCWLRLASHVPSGSLSGEGVGVRGVPGGATRPRASSRLYCATSFSSGSGVLVGYRSNTSRFL